MLKPQDIYILLKLLAWGKRDWTYQNLADELFMSASEVHAGIKRATSARLFDHHRKVPIKKSLGEFLIHGVQYAFPPIRGDITRGIATGYAAPPLNEYFQIGEELPPVWPDPEGKLRGYEFSPLYKTVTKAISNDLKLYEFLALVDAIRDGKAREKDRAIQEIKIRLSIK